MVVVFLLFSTRNDFSIILVFWQILPLVARNSYFFALFFLGDDLNTNVEIK